MTAERAGLHVQVLGEGNAVVLVHGSLTTDPLENDWSQQRGLAESYRLVIPARRGYGRSPDADRGDFEADAEDIAGLLGDGAHLGVSRTGGSYPCSLRRGGRKRCAHWR